MVSKTSSKLKIQLSKAPGHDSIPTRILKFCIKEIAPVLTVIFIQSLTSRHIPNDWLTANITPVFKKGDRSNTNNNRPIFLTLVCCKILEHIMYHHIADHLKTNNILIDEQLVSEQDIHVRLSSYQLLKTYS